MGAPQLLILILVILVFWFLPTLGLCLLFRKAGVSGWKGWVPVYNLFVMVRISGRPWYWVLLSFVPIIGLFFTLAIAIEFIKTFGKTRFYQHVLLSLSAGLYFLYIGLKSTDGFEDPAVREARRVPAVWGWLGTTVIFIATITGLRGFVFESYLIPTTSMEGTLLRGDWLFVSKLSYGPRLPYTPISFPYLPGLFPSGFRNLYSEGLTLSYHRWFSHPVGRGDVIVFNFPEGDTVISLPDYQSLRPYYDVIRELGAGNVDSGRRLVLDNPEEYPIKTRLVDKEEAYIKRSVAVAGDTFEIRNQVIYIDGQPQPFPPGSEIIYRVETNGQQLDETDMKQQYQVDINNIDKFRVLDSSNQYMMMLTWSTREKMLKDGFARRISPEVDSSAEGVFPNDQLHHWTRDNYGPIWIPRKGATLELMPENYSVYERVIRVYEGNKLEMRNGKIFLNDREENKYTFKMDYYWVMGDNLHGAQDSRYWGFVPEDHVIGKAWLIGMSWGEGVRWDRLFKKVN